MAEVPAHDVAANTARRVANGLIAEEWICSDTATLFQQIS